MEIVIPGQKIPVEVQTDVLVCGGGCAGVTAAISAARRGVEVCLLERWPSVGGMATNALVNGWHRSDREKVVILGLVEESAQRAEPEGWIVRDPKYPHAHETHWFEPEGMRIVWQRMLDEAGVRTFCYSVAGDPIVEDGLVKGVVVDTKLGRRAFLGRIVIDATGDGDIAAKAGVPYEYGRSEDGLVQGMTLMYTLRDIESEAVRSLDEGRYNELFDDLTAAVEHGELPPLNAGNTRALLRRAINHEIWNMCPAAGNPLREEELSKLTAESRERIVAYLEYFRKHIPGYEHVRLEQTGCAMGVRESRRVRGVKTLDAGMVLDARKQSDALGHGVWMIDIHDPKGTGYTTFTDRSSTNMLQTGTSYHIPFGMCVNDEYANLGVVGRCASSTHEAHSSVRVETHCMVMGQGVGTAAAMSLESDAALRDVDIRALQRNLRADGVYLEDIPESDPT